MANNRRDCCQSPMALCCCFLVSRPLVTCQSSQNMHLLCITLLQLSIKGLVVPHSVFWKPCSQTGNNLRYFHRGTCRFLSIGNSMYKTGTMWRPKLFNSLGQGSVTDTGFCIYSVLPCLTGSLIKWYRNKYLAVYKNDRKLASWTQPKPLTRRQREEFLKCCILWEHISRHDYYTIQGLIKCLKLISPWKVGISNS